MVKKRMKNSFKRIVRYATLITIDVFLLLSAWELSYYINSQHLWSHTTIWPGFHLLAFMTAIQIVIFVFLKIYWITLRTVSLELVYKGGLGLLIGHFMTVIFVSGFTSNINILHLLLPYWSMSTVFIFGYRLAFRMFRGYTYYDTNHEDMPRTLLYGGGEVADQLLRLYRKDLLSYKIIGIIDDNPLKHHTLQHGKAVMGGYSDLERIITDHRIDVVVISTMKMHKSRMDNVIDVAKDHDVEVKIIPSTIELESSKKTIADIRDIQVEDLLGRDPVSIDREPILEMIMDKRVLVTGAGGTIGSEICSQLMTYNPKQVIILDIDETEIHNLALKLNGYNTAFSRTVTPVVCDVRDAEKIERLFSTYSPDIVFHAAANKHVPLMEYFPEEALKTNIGGSYNVLTAAVKMKVSKCIVISTDKAVNPTNVMGATKRMSELIGSALSNDTTEIVSVRFGNVLGSRGSMLPLFMDQIKAGLPITVTHKEIIRYFMSIPEAVSLVFLAGSIGNGKEVMVLDMGHPIRIYDFAQNLVKKFGDGRSKIIITGLRPGEKLYEELLASRDKNIPTNYRKVFRAQLETSMEKRFIEQFMRDLYTSSPEEMIEQMKTYIPGFVRNGNGSAVTGESAQEIGQA